MTNLLFVRFTCLLVATFLTLFVKPAMGKNILEQFEIENRWWLINARDLSDFQRPLEISELVKFQNGTLFSHNIGYNGDTINYKWIGEGEVMLSENYRMSLHLESKNTLRINFQGKSVIYYCVDHLECAVGHSYESVISTVTRGIWTEDTLGLSYRSIFFSDLKYPKDKSIDWRIMVTLKIEFDSQVEETDIQSVSNRWAVKVIDGIIFIWFSESTDIDPGYYSRTIPDPVDIIQQNRVYIIQKITEYEIEMIEIDINGKEWPHLIHSHL